VIEERSAKGRMEEVIRQCVFLSEQPFRHICGVKVAHGQPGVIAPSDKPIHCTLIDLRLLMPVAVNEVARRVVRHQGRILQNVVGKQGIESGRKPQINLPVVDRLGWGGQLQRSGYQAEWLTCLRTKRLVEPVRLIQGFG